MTARLRRDLPDVPPRIAALPRDHRGYPVPWFVAWPDGTPDHRIVDPEKLVAAVREHRCWVCGQRLGTYLAFVIGPMCAVNRISSEPPSHRECAEFSAIGCPFLSRPKAKRRTAGLPDNLNEPAGVMLRRNPGATLVWVTKSYRVQRVENGYLFGIGDPEETVWYAEGRRATRAEVMHSIATGLPALQEAARAQSKEAERELERCHHAALALVPVA